MHSNTVTSNILDPIHDQLPPTVWDNPESDKPILKERHRKWIEKEVHKAFRESGYTHTEKWLSLVLTGSLTTYQFDKGSDCDISLFVDSGFFPEWSRAEMIGIMISRVDGRILPGTPYPMQCFVVPADVKREDLYKPGLRSGYELRTSTWIIPPDREKSMDVQSKLPGFYAYALEQADKMESLLRYEPEKAKLLWHQIHERRRKDQKAGKGDYSSSNIVYKFLANRGLFKSLSDLTGEYIARTSSGYDTVINWRPDQRAVDIAARKLNVKFPVRVRYTDMNNVWDKKNNPSGEYPTAGQIRHFPSYHEIIVPGWVNSQKASGIIWHELIHAVQYERGEKDIGNIPHPNYNDEATFDDYWNHPLEEEARQYDDAPPFPLALPPVTSKVAAPGGGTYLVAKWAYDPVNHIGIMGQMGRAENENLTHNQLAQQLPTQGRATVYGEIHENGRAETLSRPRLKTGPKADINMYKAWAEAEIFVKKAVPGATFTRPAAVYDSFKFEDPKVIYAGDPPQIDLGQENQTDGMDDNVWVFS